MAFKLPAVPTRKSKFQFDKNVNLFEWKDIRLLNIIGSGTFGEVTKVNYDGRIMSVKRLLSQSDEDRKSYLKEVNILNALSHENVMTLKGVCPEKCAVLMDYMAFDFSCFGADECVSSLFDFLQYIDRMSIVNEFDFSQHICIEMCKGLQYLHSKGMAHRDLKPANVLVSNQHYAARSRADIVQQFKKKPLVVKLADFGEARSELYHTSTFIHTRTQSFGRGTVPFTAPEMQLGSTSLPEGASQDDLMRADIWSLGMIIFNVINPARRYPHEVNIKTHKTSKHTDFISLLRNIIRTEMPMADPKYMGNHSTCWINLFEAYQMATSVTAAQREPLSIILAKLQESSDLCTGDVKSIKCSQQSALVNADADFARDTSTTYSLPANDGTNACAFLSLMVCDWCMSKPGAIMDEIVSQSASIINEGPLRFNRLRNANKFYVVDEAKQILDKAGIIRYYSLTEKIVSDCGIFTAEGRDHLLQAITSLQSQTAVYTCSPYTLTVHNSQGLYYIIDTHPVPSSMGGDGNGVVVKLPTSELVVKWLLYRLHKAGVKYNEPQSFNVVEVETSLPR